MVAQSRPRQRAAADDTTGGAPQLTRRLFTRRCPSSSFTIAVIAGGQAGRSDDFPSRRPTRKRNSFMKTRRTSRLYADRTARRHRDYRGPDRPAAARRAIGPRGSPAGPVHQQPQANRPGHAQLPHRDRDVPAGWHRGRDRLFRAGYTVDLGDLERPGTDAGLPGTIAAVQCGNFSWAVGTGTAWKINSTVTRPSSACSSALRRFAPRRSALDQHG